ncbi:MAG: hypothetical protein ACK5D5_01385, partial [Bacteroidota bacterium]
NTITISGTPTASGTFNYTIPLTGGCGSLNATGTIVVTPLPGWYNTQFPSSATICVGGSASVYGQVFLSGVTNSAGQASGMTAQLGYSTSNTDPSTWSNWINASFNTQSGNNDEFVSSIGSSLSSGTYYYAFRYSYNGCTYVYGGLNGPWNGTTSGNGTLTIDPYQTITLSSSIGTNAQSVCQGAAITNITYNIGSGGTGATVSGLPSGVSGSYSSGVFTISGTASAASNTYTYTVTTTGPNSCTTSVTGSIVVNPAPDFYNTQFPGTSTICQGGNATFYGQVYEGGITDPAGQASGLTAEIGYSTSNTNPNTWTNWVSASFNAQAGNNDDFVATIGSRLAPGP